MCKDDLQNQIIKIICQHFSNVKIQLKYSVIVNQ